MKRPKQRFAVAGFFDQREYFTPNAVFDFASWYAEGIAARRFRFERLFALDLAAVPVIRHLRRRTVGRVFRPS